MHSYRCQCPISLRTRTRHHKLTSSSNITNHRINSSIDCRPCFSYYGFFCKSPFGRIENPQTDRAAAIVEQYGCKTENLIAILQDIQAAYNYLSEANLTLVADRLGISVSKVYSVATFYENFSLEAKGRHIIKVCAGTACHVRKSGPIYDAIYEYLGLSGKRRTSDDGMFTLETVACLGACGLAPVMTVDGEVHAKMSPTSALELLEKIRKEEAAQ